MTLKEQMPLIRVDKLYESLRYNEYSPENGCPHRSLHYQKQTKRERTAQNQNY